MTPQSTIRQYLYTHRRATQRELHDLRVTFDVRKIISRLRRNGDPIETIYTPGVDPYATYVWNERKDLV